MKFVSFAIKSAFLTGAVIGSFVKKEKIIEKIKKAQIKKNTSASVK